MHGSCHEVQILPNVRSGPWPLLPTTPEEQVKRQRAALYHRASTRDQDPALCRDELRQAAATRDCEVVLDIEEVGSGRRDLPGLQQVMDAARRGRIDVVLCWKVDRFGRSMVNLVANVRELKRAGVTWVATSQGLEIVPRGDAVSNLVFNMLAACAEFESTINSERTRRGMEKRRAEGGHLGRPRKPGPSASQITELMAEQDLSQRKAAQALGIDPSELRRILKRAQG